ncbi:MAG: hypothetical protein AAF593_13865 [Planctomycetota bacterium]
MSQQGSPRRKAKPNLDALRAQAGVVETKTRQPAEEAVDGGIVTRFVIPGVILAAAVVWRLLQPSGPIGLSLVSIEAVFSAVLSTVLFVLGAKIVDHEIVDWVSLPLKIAAIGTLSLAAAWMIESFDADPDGLYGKVFALHAIFLVWFFGILGLFKIDLLDGTVCTIAAGAGQIGVIAALCTVTDSQALLFN